MKRPLILLMLLLLSFCIVHSALAQSVKLSPAVLKNAVIKMKQEAPSGWGTSISPYVITLSGNGVVTFDGMDEGKAISKYDPPVKIVRKTRISEKQFAELIDEFYRADFFSLEESYCCRQNSNGTTTIMKDGGLATVITSITIEGKTKSVININFAPQKLVELQRKIYAAAGVSRFVKLPPYWLLKFPDERFPPRDAQNPNQAVPGTMPQITYRMIPRNSPQGDREKRIDLNKKWGFIMPCVTTKTELEKMLGQPIYNQENLSLPIYNAKDEKISVFYSSEKTNDRICGDKTNIGTVILFSIIPIKDIRLSDLNINLAEFKKNDGRGNEKSYNNQAGIYIETEVVEFSDKVRAEMVTSIQFSQKR